MRSEVYFMKEKLNKQLKRGKKYLKRVKDEKEKIHNTTRHPQLHGGSDPTGWQQRSGIYD